MPIGQTQSVTNATAAASASSATAAKSIQENFMKMLVAQLQYQDPTNPMDSAQMTSQLSQMSTVDGVNNLNTKMAAMLESMQSTQAYQASGMVGHKVLVAGNNVDLASSKGSFAVNLTAPADNVQVRISDASGKVVNVMNLGAAPAGTLPVAWNGKDSGGNTLPDGAYSFQISATNGGKAVSATGASYGTVESVSNDENGVRLNLKNSSAAVGISNVLQIL